MRLCKLSKRWRHWRWNKSLISETENLREVVEWMDKYSSGFTAVTDGHNTKNSLKKLQLKQRASGSKWVEWL